jgi:hypothetical protein
MVLTGGSGVHAARVNLYSCIPRLPARVTAQLGPIRRSQLHACECRREDFQFT